MTVLDAQAMVAYLRKEPAAPAVKKLLAGRVAMSVLNVAEVMDRLVRGDGRRPDDLEQDLTVLERGGLRLLPVTDELAILAGRLRAQHYDRKVRSVSLADCVAAVTALTQELPLATADPALAAVVRAEGGEVHALPDSKGVMP